MQGPLKEGLLAVVNEPKRYPTKPELLTEDDRHQKNEGFQDRWDPNRGFLYSGFKDIELECRDQNRARIKYTEDEARKSEKTVKTCQI